MFIRDEEEVGIEKIVAGILWDDSNIVLHWADCHLLMARP